jgi:hypothetical protein
MLVASAAALVIASPSSARVPKPDSAAPPGAAADWLPREEWVGERWLPFDETVLERRLGMDVNQLFTYLNSTGNSLNDLARAKRVATPGFAAQLVAPLGAKAGSARRAILLQRTRRVLSQSHLAAHMLGHVFHVWTLTEHPDAVFGVGLQQFNRLYFGQHQSMVEIASSAGVDADRLRARALAAARAAAARGVGLGAMSRRQAQLLRLRDEQGFRSWARYRVPGATVARAAVGRRDNYLCHLVAG